VVAKGKKIVRFDLRNDRPSDDELLDHMLGRSGALRAPSLRAGRTFVVGYNADLLESVLG
jgi:arsenate reductase-like glutaredoxin family protein